MAREVNEAVEIAHKQGILSAASLMTAGRAVEDAVGRARSMPRLRVGLHLALTDAWPALPAAQIPDLVDRAGRLRADLARLGFDLAVSRAARRQMRAEIEAQFAAFRATGLPLDHVNVHQHYHLHPIVAAIVIDVGRAYGMSALRVPHEPRDLATRIDASSGSSHRAVERFCAALVRRRTKRAGLRAPDGVIGLRWSGQATAQRVRAALENLPPGFWEIYLHPATEDVFPGSAPGYRYKQELAALIDPLTIEALRRAGLCAGGYQDGA